MTSARAGRALKWFGWSVLVLFIAGVLFLVLFDWNALRGPIARAVEERTGRELRIEGDLKPIWSWVHPRVLAGNIRFANPQWAKEDHLVRAEAVVASVRVLPLLRGRVVLPEVHLVRPEVSLEIAADGRRSWLLDMEASDEDSRVEIQRLTVDEGRLRFIDAGNDTDLTANLSTRGDADGIVFEVKGRYQGMPAAARGHGGSIIAVRDETMPYPIKIDATIGRTGLSAEGNVRAIARLGGADLAVKLQGESLEHLFPIIGIALPDTGRYSTSGRLIRQDASWRYEGFTGRIGQSDVAGTLQVDLGGKRPFLHGEVKSKLLNFADLGPLVGTRKPSSAGFLPDAPFDAQRWDSVDAEVKIQAAKIRRPEQLPIERLATRIQMRDALLTLDPLEFGIAGGRLGGTISLDGRHDPIRAAAKLRVHKLELAKLAPTGDIANTSLGDVSGAIELAGRGNSVARMLASANGKVGLFVDGGTVSHFLMELVAIDLWGMAKVKLKGDEPIAIRCWIADFAVKDGVMEANALVFDTEVVNITGGGIIDLKKEEISVKLVPEPKDLSLASLNSPLYITGTFSDPDIAPDIGRIAAKGLGAIVMGIINPLLSVIPLIKEGKGRDSNCEALIADAAKLPGRGPKPPPR
jgi:uncharacterized protein involved in outer membrane biogenesis